jgi:uncharacterized membrane protein
VSPAWTVVILVGTATVAIKAAGPLLLADRELPAAATGVMELLAPALLAALVATQAFGGDRALVLDARAGGLAAAAVAVALRVPILGVVVIAAATTAASRAFGG